MHKRLALIILSATLLFLVWEGAQSWRVEDSHLPGVKTGDKSVAAAGAQQEDVSFYPQVPAQLPDLNQGYLFNAERFLSGEEEETGAAEAELEETGPAIDMEKLFYSGSIIIGDIRKGLVVFEDPDFNLRQKETTRSAKARSKSTSKTKYAQLAVNDQLGGFSVTEVEADHITFEKGGQSIEKMLHDSNKTRLKPPARQKAVPTQKAVKTSAKKKVTLGSPASTSRTRTSTTNRTIRKPRVVQSRRVRTPIRSPARTIEPQDSDNDSIRTR